MSFFVSDLQKKRVFSRFRKENGLPNIHNVYVDNAINGNESCHSSKYTRTASTTLLPSRMHYSSSICFKKTAASMEAASVASTTVEGQHSTAFFVQG